MDDNNIDESKRKPRRARGTPFTAYRNRIAWGFLVAGSSLFALWAYTPIFRKCNERLAEALFHRSEYEIDRRYFFSFSKPLPANVIQARLDEAEELSKR